MASRLAQMQARFQQKQIQEKEEKLLKLYENQQQRVFERVGRGSAGSNTSMGSTGGGKVRQMFDERRQKAGVDKSYPLEPLKPKAPGRGTSIERTVAKSSSSLKKTVSSKIRTGTTTTDQKQNNNNYNEIDGHNNLVELMNGHNLADNEQIGDNYQPLYMTGKLANLGGTLPSQKVEPKAAPSVVTQRNGPVRGTAKKAVAAKTAPPVPRSTSSVSSGSNQSSRSSPTRSDANMNTKQPSGQSIRAPTNNRPSSKQTAKSPVIRDDLAQCRFCGRRFATDRLGTHEDICGKTGKKKRKVYDTTKHRTQGTELESYVIRGAKKAGGSSKIANKQSSTAPKTNWRKTHEEFIAAIRAAKHAQAYVAKGGKLSDLPPPPPSTNPDYVQCPHCGRRFNEAAAERHIPKCASYSFNKPKNGGPQQKGKPSKR